MAAIGGQLRSFTDFFCMCNGFILFPVLSSSPLATCVHVWFYRALSATVKGKRHLALHHIIVVLIIAPSYSQLYENWRHK